MSNRRSKKPALAGVIVVALMAVTAVVGLAAYVQYAQNEKPLIGEGEHRNKPKGPEVSVETQQPEAGGTVTVFEAYYDGDDLKFRQHKQEVPRGEDARVFAVNQFLQQTKITEPNARLLGVDVRDGTATLSFNSAFAQTYGTEDEHTLLDGIRWTMGQFKDVKLISFYADGQPIETLGNVELTEPLSVLPESPGEGSTSDGQ